MKAVILAGGFGSRLSEETSVRPKPMVEIGGKPMLWHIMKIYAAHGIEDFVICLGYRGYMIKEYFANYYLHTCDVSFDLAGGGMEVHRSATEPWRVTLVDTGEATMTGGRLRRVLQYVDGEDFCFTYGDGLADVDVSALVAFHSAHGRSATVTAVQPPGRFGALDLEGDLVREFEEKPRGDGGWTNGGFFVLSPGVESYLDGDQTVWEQEPMRALARDGQLAVLPPPGLLAGDGHAARPQPAGAAVALGARALGDVDTTGVSAPGETAPAAAGGAVDASFWQGRRVLLTGHTGFKGAWLSLWLQALGAHVTGFSDGVPTEPCLFELARVGEGMESVRGDVRDPAAVAAALAAAGPEVVIHMAAQSLVRRSFAEPRETFQTNVMGTVNVLDAVRLAGGGVRVVVNVTSDKCYENREWEWGYRETEPMGGHDPYSSSKGAAELVTAAFRRSFFSDPDGPRLASARAGNVIGGGDWGEDRLVPDIMRAALAGERVRVRNPNSIRPWQHVLNPLSGYLVLAQALWESPARASGWNFGPAEEDARPVGWIVQRLSELWDGGLESVTDEGPHPHEARYLKLDSSRARADLGWRPLVGLERALEATVGWYERLRSEADMRAVTTEQIEALAGG